MQRLAREIIQSKEFWIICCFKLRHAVTESLHEALSNCASEPELFESHIDLSQSIGSTLSCRDFFQQIVDPEQLTSSNQPTN